MFFLFLDHFHHLSMFGRLNDGEADNCDHSVAAVDDYGEVATTSVGQVTKREERNESEREKEREKIIKRDWLILIMAKRN